MEMVYSDGLIHSVFLAKYVLHGSNLGGGSGLWYVLLHLGDADTVVGWQRKKLLSLLPDTILF